MSSGETNARAHIQFPKDFTGEQHFSTDLMCDGHAIGTITLSDYGDYLWVDHIANLTDGDYREVGTALQELIFRLSLSMSDDQLGGRVHLDAQGLDSSQFHESLGYEFLYGKTKGIKGAEQGVMYLPDMRIRQLVNENLKKLTE